MMPVTIDTSRPVLVCGFIVTAIAVFWRLVGIDEWPYRFHETVQYESAMASRKIWSVIAPSQTSPAHRAWYDAVGAYHVTSPPVLPGMVAVCHAFAGNEIPWCSAVFGCVFWITAGWGIYLAVSRLTGSPIASLVAMTWFNLSSYGVMVSRSFQTEPLLAMGFAAVVCCFARKERNWNWRNLIQVGLLCGAASFLKPGVLVLPILVTGMVLIVLVNGSDNLRTKALKFFTFTAIAMAPSIVYALFMLQGHLRAKIIPELLMEQSFYQGLSHQIRVSVGRGAILAGLAGVIVATCFRQYLPSAMVLGYILYILVFPHHTSTHSYYHVPLMVIVALSIGCLTAAIVMVVGRKVCTPRSRWIVDLFLVAIFALFLFSERHYYVGPWQWTAPARAILSDDFVQQQQQIQQYEQVGALIPAGTKVIAVSDFYGYALEYYTHLRVYGWPSQSDLAFTSRIDPIWAKSVVFRDAIHHLIQNGYEYFVITDVESYNNNIELVLALEIVGRKIPTRSDILIFQLKH